MANPNLFQTARTPIYGKGGTFSYTGTAGTSTVFPAGTTGVFFWATTDVYVRAGVSPTAVTTDMPVPAYTPVFVPCVSETGQLESISAVRIASDGNAYFVPVG